MDHEPRTEPKKSSLQLKRCSCSTKATIKTVYNLGLVAYHCSDLCLGYWKKSGHVKIIKQTERSIEGFPAETK